METTLRVTGMTCGNCVKHVTEALQAVPGVKKAKVALDEGLAQIKHKGVDPEVLTAAVTDAGYTATVG